MKTFWLLGRDGDKSAKLIDTFSTKTKNSNYDAADDKLPDVCES